MKARGDRSEEYTLPCLLDQLHFSTVPPYLLLTQPDESFMYWKLKNAVVEHVDEGGDERKQQEKNEGERAIKETNVRMKEDGVNLAKLKETRRRWEQQAER